MALIATPDRRTLPRRFADRQVQGEAEIWQKWPEFEAAVKNFGSQADKLRDAARTKDLAATEAVAKEFRAPGVRDVPHAVPCAAAPAAGAGAAAATTAALIRDLVSRGGRRPRPPRLFGLLLRLNRA